MKMKPFMWKVIAALFLAMPAWVLASDASFEDFDFTEIGKVMVQHKGRVKPIDTYAREVVGKVTGRQTFRPQRPQGADSLPGSHALAVLLSWTFEPEKWVGSTDGEENGEHDSNPHGFGAKDRKEGTKASEQQDGVPIIRVDYRPFKERIGLDPDAVYFTFQQVAENESLRKLQKKVHAKTVREGEEVKLDRMEREVMDVAGKVELVDAIFQGFTAGLVPHPKDKDARWLPMPALAQGPPEASEALEAGVLRLWVDLGMAFRERRGGDFNAKARELRAALNSLSKNVYKEETPALLSKMEWETHYNRVHAFRIAAAFYFLGLAMLLVSLFWRSSMFYRLCLAVSGLGIITQIYGFVIRVLVTERPPVSNMYESMVFMGFMVTVFAMMFELIYRSRVFGISASFLSLLLLILADQLPLDKGLDPLLPVLRTNYWLTVHVLTVMSAYAALTLAMGVGHINLGIYFFAPHRKELLGKMTLFLYRTIQLGFLLITTGTILGAWWAGEAWDRYWGWDPKETWAFICILGYGILLHGRMAGFWGPFGTAIGSVIAWSLVGMCYYGVNFVLGAGLHSYGFGDGGIQFAIGYLVVETLIVAAAFYGKYAAKYQSATRDEIDREGPQEKGGRSAAEDTDPPRLK